MIAVNTRTVPQQSTFAVDGVHDGTAQALWESRSVQVHGGKLTDSFPPLGVHVYAIG